MHVVKLDPLIADKCVLVLVIVRDWLTTSGS